MKIIVKYKFILILLFFFSAKVVDAQFYNGHQMTFGKNRVQYLNKYWRYHRYDKFDTYFYKNGDSLSMQIAGIAEVKIPDIENFFGYGIQKRLIFLCYKSLSDFRESNVGYDSGNENSNIGGVTKIIDNKVFIYYEGDKKNLEKQIVEGITKVLINDMLYSGSYTKKFTNSTLIELPEWYEEGLISYLSEEWSFEIENRIKDGFRSKKFKKINRLIGEDAKFAGHSFWYFIGEAYGKDVIPSIIYLTRINKNSDLGFKYVLGLSIKELSPVWKNFYAERFDSFTEETILPDKSTDILKGKKNTVYQRVKISPDNKYISYVANQSGKFKIYLYDKKTGKQKTVIKKGHKLDQITDYSYPVLAWHPSGKLLSFFIEEQGRLRMYMYNVEDNELKRRNIMYFDKILSADYSDDGFLIVFSAVKDAQTDIYIYNVSASNFDRITNDNYVYLNPEFVDKSRKIIFSSDRDNIFENNDYYSPKDLFIYDIKKNEFFRLTNTPYFNDTHPIEVKENKYSSLTDKTGIIGRQIIEYDSTVSYIDTAIHYRYFTNDYLTTDYTSNIESYDINKKDKSSAELIFNRNRFHIYNDIFSYQEKENVAKTYFRKIFTEKVKYKDSINKIEKENERIQQLRLDSLRNNPPSNLLHPDSIPVDINNYVFETERNIEYYKLNPIIDTALETNEDSSEFLPTYNYLTNFYTNHIVQQVDFGLLNSSYQAFTGSAFYFVPGVNIFTKIGIYDLFEDYRVTGGVRLGANLDSYEYLFSLENLKYKIDRQYIYHRQTYTNKLTNSYGYYYLWKMYSNEGMYILKYPFSQVASVKATLSLRHDRVVFLSTDMATLAEPSQYQFFSGAKLEYNYDDVKSLGTNLYDGTRFKIFTEFYQEVDQNYTNLLVLGADFRFYKKIHRNLIFAGRAAGSASFGKSRLLYYLGGVDNWYVINPNKMQFDNSVDINEEQQYVYQAVATNMRGFIQNARNGTNFAVINNEIRFPIVRYLANRPLNSALLNNFQIIGFADAGAAWSGLSPFDPLNAYNTETVKTGPVTVIIDKNRWPVIYGYGFGLRSKVFGYFVRLDWARGYDSGVLLPRIFYFSLNLDF
ncbi:MAG: hypothetical protein L3J35_03125 [Bacteroidales bacterium]|nr:hypothetical protein [Bacteroidales bacterium]